MDINDILNLDGVDINEKIVDAIDMSRVELEKLTTDLTYKQFKSADFIDVLLQGYTKIDNDDLQDYLSIVGNGITNITLEELFFSKTK